MNEQGVGEGYKALDDFLARTGKTIASRKKFTGGDDFEASSKAQQYAKAQGYDAGSMQRDAPIALAKDVEYIAKWRNISRSEWDRVEGMILSDDMRNGDVEVITFTGGQKRLVDED